MVVEIIGWIASGLFALCGLPQAYQSWKLKHSDGLTWGFLTMWLGGEILMLVYLASKSDVLPLLVNYYLNLVFVCIMLWYKIFPKNKNEN